MPLPRLSVLVTVYNGETYLPSTLASILGQTFADFELLVIDDGSQDGTWEILEALAARDGRIQLLRNERNLGVPPSMNRLFRLARGQYVNRHDSDDLSHPTRYASQISYLDSHPAIGLLGSQVQVIDGSGRPVASRRFEPPLKNAEIQMALLQGNCLCQGAVMFRRQLLDDVGHYDESFMVAQDYDLWLRMAEVTELAVLDEMLYQYRLHPESLGHRRRYEQTYHSARSLERALQRRFGGQSTPAQRLPAATLYLRAAIASFAASQLETARRWLRQALELHARLLAGDDPLLTIVMDYAVKFPPEAAVLFVDQVFADLLPSTARLNRLRARLISDLHMRVVFASVRARQVDSADAHLWAGVRHNPAWLLNRGVLSLLARSLVRPR